MTHLEDEFVVFEVQVRKWGLFKEPVETVKSEIKVIDCIRFERGLFKDSVHIVPRRSELLTVIPGDNKGGLQLKIPKRYRDDVEEFVTEVRLKMRELKSA